MARYRPWIAVLENVENLDSSGKSDDALVANRSNLDQCRDILKEQGYGSFVMSLNSKDYGMPQDRPRIFVGCVGMEHFHYNA